VNAAKSLANIGGADRTSVTWRG